MYTVVEIPALFPGGCMKPRSFWKSTSNSPWIIRSFYQEIKMSASTKLEMHIGRLWHYLWSQMSKSKLLSQFIFNYLLTQQWSCVLRDFVKCWETQHWFWEVAWNPGPPANPQQIVRGLLDRSARQWRWSHAETKL